MAFTGPNPKEHKMSVKQRIARVMDLGTLIMFSILSGFSRSFKLDQITYEIVSKLECPEGVYLKIDDNGIPIVCANSLVEIQNFFRSFGINELPGKKPCQPHCCLCNGKCLAQAA